jgi:hypothetical protein
VRFLADTNDWGLITPLSSFLLAFPKMVYKHSAIARKKPYSRETRRTAKILEQDIVKHKLSGSVTSILTTLTPSLNILAL